MHKVTDNLFMAKAFTKSNSDLYYIKNSNIMKDESINKLTMIGSDNGLSPGQR